MTNFIKWLRDALGIKDEPKTVTIDIKNTKLEGSAVYDLVLYGDKSGALMFGATDGVKYCLSVILVNGEPQLKLTPQGTT